MGDFFFNTSILTGEYITEYSPQARADADYNSSGGDFINETIRKLKSHNWYVQNPAVNSITPEAIDTADKDALFVLGRNLYQCACGGSSAALILISDVSTFLRDFDEEVGFHILNGMLYEVYFDSSNRFRKIKKTEELDALLCLDNDEDFALSFEFIRQVLLPHLKELFYIPGRNRNVMVDIKLSAIGEDKMAVQHILCEGQDIFYRSDGTTLVSNAEEEFSYSQSPVQFEEILIREMAVPKRRIRITYSPDVPKEADLIVPYDYKVLRFGK